MDARSSPDPKKTLRSSAVTEPRQARRFCSQLLENSFHRTSALLIEVTVEVQLQHDNLVRLEACPEQKGTLAVSVSCRAASIFHTAPSK